MEIDITDFLKTECPRDYSASAFEIGDDAGKCTWQAAVDNADPIRFLTSKDRRDVFRSFLKDSGGWSKDEIESFNVTDLEALMIQWIAGDLRNMFGRELMDFSELTDEQWFAAEQLQHDGQVSSNIFRGNDGRVYFYIGN